MIESGQGSVIFGKQTQLYLKGFSNNSEERLRHRNLCVNDICVVAFGFSGPSAPCAKIRLVGRASISKESANTCFPDMVSLGKFKRYKCALVNTRIHHPCCYC